MCDTYVENESESNEEKQTNSINVSRHLVLNLPQMSTATMFTVIITFEKRSTVKSLI